MPEDQTQPQPNNNSEADIPYPEVEPSTESVSQPSTQAWPQQNTAVEPTQSWPQQPEVVEPVQTVPTETPLVQPEPVLLAPPKKKKKGLIVGLIIASVLVVLGAGSALAYNVWYQNPQKVITDAIINAAMAESAIYKGTITVDSDDYKFKVDVNAKQADLVGSVDAKITMTAEGKDYVVNGAGLIDKAGDLYVKVENLNDIVAQYKNDLEAVDPSYFVAIESLVAKIDGTWIKISSDDLKSFSEEYATTKTCIDDTVAKFKDDKLAINQISDLYKNNQFIVIDEKLGAKDGSLGYNIKTDETIAKVFAEGLKNTSIYKSLSACDETFEIDSSDITTKNDDGTDTQVELWVSRWTHDITKLSINEKTDESTISFVVLPTFDQPVTVTTPQTSITLSELQEDMTELFQSTITE